MDTPTDLYTLPAEFLSRLKTIVPEHAYESVCHAYEITRNTTFRTNTLKTTSGTLQNTLEKQGFSIAPVPGIADAWTLTNKDLRALTDTDQYKNGELYVQSLSSMLPPIVLSPRPGEKVLDIAAAPGSKTTQIAALMHNEGEIVANDSSLTRMYRLASNLQMQGVTIAKTVRKDARSIWQDYPEYFDRTLVDVPCSMDGRFYTPEPKTYEDWTLKKVKDLAHLQRWILRSAVSATKPGGIIVYSTCTLSPEENENIIEWILKKEKGHVRVEDISLDIPTQPALMRYAGHDYHAHMGRTVRLYPSETMEGFYIAKLKKVGSTVMHTPKGPVTLQKTTQRRETMKKSTHRIYRA